MTEKRVQFSTIVKNQFPGYVQEEYPLSEEFFSQYYKSQEYQGAPLDILQNIDKYVKLDNNADIIDSTILTQNVSFSDQEIFVANTQGFPDTYGLIKIDNEIITYTGKTQTSFTGCVRGFSGITSYFNPNNPEELIFSDSEVDEHTASLDDQGQFTKEVKNLSSLFLKEFFRKTKYQIAPGFENRQFYDNESDNPSERLKLNQSLFIKQLKDFYKSKGTDFSFEILFKALYNERVKVVRPREQLFRPSDAHYRKTKDIVVEKISGNPLDLRNSTLFQESYGNIQKAYAPVTRVEKVTSGFSTSDYYKISLDSDYNRDLIVEGAVYGEFSIHATSKVIGNVSVGSTYIDVDSTVGFPNSGNIRVTYDDGSVGIVSYSSKNLTQFTNCSNVSKIILDTTKIGINTYAYGQSIVDGSEIQVRVTSVLNNLKLPENSYYFQKDDSINVKSLGDNSKSKKINNWLLNISPTYLVKDFSIINTANNIGVVTTKTASSLKIGDSVTFIGSNNSQSTGTIIDVKSENTYSVVGQGALASNGQYKLKRNLLKNNTNVFPTSSFINSNVQNVYVSEDKNSILVASPSIPYYSGQPLNPANQKIVFSGSYPPVGIASTDIIQLTTLKDHGLYTGDSVYYTPQKQTTTSPEGFTSATILSSLGDNIPEGIYFIKRVDQYNVKLSRSRSDIFNGRFAYINSNVTPSSNIIEKYDLRGKTLESQKLLREISSPVNDGQIHETIPGKTGMLINGVEILNYKSQDSIFYGGIEEIEVTSPGQDYDVINPPILNISDSVGTGATGYCAVSGFLEEIRILDPGFDYTETPIIKITGGNGTGANAVANMKLIEHSVSFNSNANASLVGVGTTISTIGFSTYHKFRNGEKVIYTTNGQQSISGLVDNSVYYVHKNDEYTLKLHKSSGDAISGINTISLLSYGVGDHTLKSFSKKSVLSSVQVLSPGFGYQNKKRTSSVSGINTASNTISIRNHGYGDGDIVKYTTNGTDIGGLQSGNEYYVLKIDSDTFGLSLVGTALTAKDYFYKIRQLVDINSKGSGEHIFNYPDISVEVIGNVGISSTSNETFKAVLQPVFRGQITSVHVSNSGSGYGSEEIINFYRDPSFTLYSGQDAQLTAIVSNGRISEVLVNNSGKSYFAPPNLEIVGDGIGAVLVPILSGGKIVDVKVLEPGFGYNSGNTFINVISPGRGAEFRAKIQSWTVNNFKRYLNDISGDDGVLTNGIGDEFGLQYCHLYAPRKLRETIYSLDQSGNQLYGNVDLKKSSSGDELNSTTHSPIIGWAYDGNPIYGPYGYESKIGGSVKQLKSGYKEESSKKNNRPSLSFFPAEFFVEDFTYINGSDDLVLDENNGRFCITPDFPNGTYAYFATFSESIDSDGTFVKYKKPKFPYLIGNGYNSKPIDFNFKKASNQDGVDLNKTLWKRFTANFQINDDVNTYDYLTVPNLLSQKSKIKYAAPGTLDYIGIVTGGSGYKVNDSLIFNNEGTGGFGANAIVSRVSGKSVSNISVATSSISNVEFYPADGNGNFILFAENPHSYINGDIVTVSGVSTTNTLLEGSYTAGITTGGRYVLNVGVGSTAVTGIVTYFQILGDLTYPNLSVNDILGIGTEQVRVLNIEPNNSRVRVLRSINGTVGASHTQSTLIYQAQRKVRINVGYNTSFNNTVNKQIYFDPTESVALGTNYGVGIGTTISFSNPGFGATQIFIPTKSIFIPNHGLKTGDEIVYSTNGGNAIGISTNGISTSLNLTNNTILYIAKISEDLVGVSTVKVGLGSTGTFIGAAATTINDSALYFTSFGNGKYHSFKTNYTNVITGTISRNLVTVSTSQTHGLTNQDTVFIDVNPSISTTVSVVYNDSSRRVLINPKSFNSVGVNTTSGQITITNHGFYEGQKVVHTTSAANYGLKNDGIYYVIYVDKNNIKLADTYEKSISRIPSYIGIASAYSGNLSAVNPEISVYKDSTIIFDLSDPSLSFLSQGSKYPAFDLNFYKDRNFIEEYNTSETNGKFNVLKYGTVGVTSDARATLSVNNNSPEILYYKLDVVNDDFNENTKKEIIIDDSVIAFNQINIESSKFNGRHTVLVSSDTSFTYNLKEYPESDSYNTNVSQIAYQTDSLTAFGGISSIRLRNSGSNYYSLPGISTQLNSDLGSNSILEPYGKTIGMIKTNDIIDIGFDFPSDFTLRPTASLPTICKIDPLASFESIGVTSFGRGYSVAPKLIVIDGKTNKVVPEVDLVYDIQNKNVVIRKNTYGINNVKPTILPINNSNGVGISTISYNPITKDVSVKLSVGFSTEDSFPFSVNDRVLIENISVGVGSTAKGFNSENYGYSLFTLKSVAENRGGIGIVTYSLDGFLGSNEYPGNFDPTNSSGRIIPEKYLLKFDSVLTPNDFLKGEKIKILNGTEIGIVGNWDNKNNLLKVETNEDLIVGNILEGSSSSTQGVIKSIDSFQSFYDIDYFSIVRNGWETEIGFLSNNLQRIQDNDYYQNFSYSLRSRVDYDTWNDPVSALNHTAGYKKFSDLQMESSVPERDSGRMIVGIPTNIPNIEITTDIIGFANLNCVYNFDLAKENSLNINSRIVSDEITFANRILTDYSESVGNRVLIIDDLSGQFNSSPRPTPYSEIARFYLDQARVKKYITYVQDRRFTGERQLMLVTLAYDNEGDAFINQYGRIETQMDLGSFDFFISGTEGVLTFYPNKFTVNDYIVSTLSYNIKSVFTGVGSTTFGNSTKINTSSTQIASGTSGTIVSISTNYTSSKVILEITGNNGQYEFDEFSLIHDGTNIEFLDYGQLTNHTLSNAAGGFGLGTYYPYFSGSLLKVDFTPIAGVAVTVNTMQVSLGNTSLSGVGTVDFKNGRINSSSVSIASSASPVASDVAVYPDDYDAAYFILQVSDITNNNHQMSEIVVIDDGNTTAHAEYAYLETSSGLGTVGTDRKGGVTSLTFTPNPGIDVEVRTYMNAMRNADDDTPPVVIDFNNSSIETDFGTYSGTETDIRRAFDLQHRQRRIFQRDFNGNDSDVVDTTEDTIKVDGHFFVTGEEVKYTYAGAGTTQAIGISPTNFVGIGTTDKLPSSVYIIKVDDTKVKLASSAQNALASIPVPIDIVNVGIGTSHTFTSKNQNQKVIVAIDNLIQSPIVSTALTSSLAKRSNTIDDVLFFTGITSFFGGDLIKVDDEIMRITSVGVGSTNAVRVRRPWMGTVVVGHSTGSLVTKVEGDYNIVDNTINFVEAPYGNIPIGSTTNPPDERDWVGISTGSSFQGRTFLRSGTQGSSNETYSKNYIFNDISSQFNGLNKNFTLKSNGSNITGISNENAVILINDIFQGPGLSYDYTLSESVGVTTISFTGSASSVSYDPNNANIPVGGVIVSVGSTEGFGYQPLISAGGTVTVSSGGTITNISIGNSGSGYRGSSKYEILTKTTNIVSIGSTIVTINNENSIFKALEFNNNGSNCLVSIGTFINSQIVSVGNTFITIGSANTTGYAIPQNTSVSVSINNPQIGIVNVSVGKTNVGITTLVHVGVATISNGRVLSPVYITNGGIGYTAGLSTLSNSPYAFFESPLSYSNIPLIYSSSSAGVGTQTKIDIVVGQGSSIIDFEITNTGYGYGQGEILTIPVGGITGIPTTSEFKEFQISIQKTENDKFAGWSIGELQVLDRLDTLFDGQTKVFPITLAGNTLSIRSAPGSNIDIQATLLIFINDVLQVPGEGYVFEGGSKITFTEAPKAGDTSKIIFYKGSGSIDVVQREIIETVKIGDGLTLGYDPYSGQQESLQEEQRIVSSINSIDNVDTNPYFGPGNIEDETLLRPIVWCRQTEDRVVDGRVIGKEREIYEPQIYPTSNIIQPVGIGSTVIFVESVRPFFNASNENNTTLVFQNKITIVSQDTITSAAATAVVSAGGTIQSIAISNGGSGFTTSPTVVIGLPPIITGISSVPSGTVSTINYNVYGVSGMTTYFDGDIDDTFWELSLPFSVDFLGNRYDQVYLNSNGYITFGGGSVQYSNITPNSPSLPGIHINQGDRRVTKIYTLSSGSEYKIRVEGYNFASTAINTPYIYEVGFTNGSSSIDINLIQISTPTDGGITDGISPIYIGKFRSVSERSYRIYTSPFATNYTDPAKAVANISAGIVTSITLTNPGVGYSQLNPPAVLIESPSLVSETDDVYSYEGDFGIITGISTVSVGVASTGLEFDFFIESDSYLRNSSVTGFTTVSGISTGYYFAINDSNVGNGVTSLNENNQVVGVGTQFLDNVYRVSSVSIAQTSIPGIGITYVAKVVVSLSSYNGISGLGNSSYYGRFSWGRILVSSRTENQSYSSQNKNGYTGLSTGASVIRYSPLKYRNYLT